MPKPRVRKVAVVNVMTFPVAARELDVSPTMIRRWVVSGKLMEAFTIKHEPKSGHYRLVTVESVERLKRERKGRDA